MLLRRSTVSNHDDVFINPKLANIEGVGYNERRQRRQKSSTTPT